VVGDWTHNGTLRIGVYRVDSSGLGWWYVNLHTCADRNGYGCQWGGQYGSDSEIQGVDYDIYQFGLAGDQPVAGDWDHTGNLRIGVFRSGTWIVDLGGCNCYGSGAATYSFGEPGDQAVVGRWALGSDATHLNMGVLSAGTWYVDANGSGGWDGGDGIYSYGLAGDIPVMGTLPANISGGGTITVATPSDPVLPTPTPSMPPPMTSDTATSCGDLTGSWDDPNLQDFNGNDGQWSIVQNNSGDVSGTLTFPSCNVVYTVAGGAGGLTATPPTQSITCDGNQYQLLTFQVSFAAVTCPAAFPRSETQSQPVQSPPGPYNPAAVRGPLQWTRRTLPPGLTVTFDMSQSQVVATVTAPGKTGDLQINLKGNGGLDGNNGIYSTGVGFQAGATVDASGTTSFKFPISLAALPAPVQYYEVNATWAGLSVSLSGLGFGFTTLGYTRFSKYNTPTESMCGTAAPSKAYVFQGSGCKGDVYQFNPTFIQQASLNGEGTPSDPRFNGLLLKTWGPSSSPTPYYACPVAPPGFTMDTGTGNGNIFVVANPPASGACSTGFSDLASLATYPSPKTGSTWLCTDSLLLLNTDGTQFSGLKPVQDACPDCQGGFGAPNYPGTTMHIDTYTSSAACKGHDPTIQDYGNYFGIRLR